MDDTQQYIERMIEVGIVVLLGAMLSWELYEPAAVWFIPLLLLILRPAATNLGLAGSK